ncbi:unnamed protein product [Closterium sp. NIES-64]|nr:unnamed protein product [Closterium sp. NIES-64]
MAQSLFPLFLTPPLSSQTPVSPSAHSQPSACPPPLRRSSYRISAAGGPNFLPLPLSPPSLLPLFSLSPPSLLPLSSLSSPSLLPLFSLSSPSLLPLFTPYPLYPIAQTRPLPPPSTPSLTLPLFSTRPCSRPSLQLRKALPPTLILCVASPIVSYSRRLGTGQRVPAAGQGKGLTLPHSPPFFLPPSGARVFLQPSSPAPLLLSRAAAGGGRGTSTRRPCSWGRQGPYPLPLFSLPAAAGEGKGLTLSLSSPSRLQLGKARALPSPSLLPPGCSSGAMAFLRPASSAALLLPRATAGSGPSSGPRPLRRFSYRELQQAAGYFNASLQLGKGSFGTVFRGQVDEWLGELPRGSKREVAVKVLHTESVKAFDDCLVQILLMLGILKPPQPAAAASPTHPHTDCSAALLSLTPPFLFLSSPTRVPIPLPLPPPQAEILVLGDLRHPNLVQLLGYCMEDSRAILVYELVERGDLHHWLHPNNLYLSPATHVQQPPAFNPPCPFPTRISSFLGFPYTPSIPPDLSPDSPCLALGALGWCVHANLCARPSPWVRNCTSNQFLTTSFRPLPRPPPPLSILPTTLTTAPDLSPDSPRLTWEQPSKVADLSPDSPCLTWEQRVHVAVGMAEGVAYLHEQNIIHRDFKSHNVMLDSVSGREGGSVLASVCSFSVNHAWQWAWMAEGMADLHGQSIIHRDFKSHNVMLDHELRAKVTDFGMATRGPEEGKTHVSTRIMGTLGYLDPDYIDTGHLTPLSDVFSLGVVLLELLTGRSPATTATHNRLFPWIHKQLARGTKGGGGGDSVSAAATAAEAGGAGNEGQQQQGQQQEGRKADGFHISQVVDPRLKGQFSAGAAKKLLLVALQCSQEEPSKRPDMNRVVERLREIAASGVGKGGAQRVEGGGAGVQGMAGGEAVVAGCSQEEPSKWLEMNRLVQRLREIAAAGGAQRVEGGGTEGAGVEGVAGGGIAVAGGGIAVAGGGIAVAGGGIAVAGGGIAVAGGGIAVGGGGV